MHYITGETIKLQNAADSEQNRTCQSSGIPFGIMGFRSQ